MQPIDVVDHAALALQQVMLILAFVESQYPSSTFRVAHIMQYILCINTLSQWVVASLLTAASSMTRSPGLSVPGGKKACRCGTACSRRIRSWSTMCALRASSARSTDCCARSRACRKTCIPCRNAGSPVCATSTALLVLLSMEWPDEHARRGTAGTPRQPGTAPASAPGSFRRP